MISKGRGTTRDGGHVYFNRGGGNTSSPSGGRILGRTSSRGRIVSSKPDRSDASESVQAREFLNNLKEQYGIPLSALREAVNIISAHNKGSLTAILESIEDTACKVQFGKAARYRADGAKLREGYRAAAGDNNLHQLEGKQLEYALSIKGPDFLYEIVDLNRNIPELRDIQELLFAGGEAGINEPEPVRETVRSFMRFTRLNAELLINCGKSVKEDRRRREEIQEAGMDCFRRLRDMVEEGRARAAGRGDEGPLTEDKVKDYYARQRSTEAPGVRRIT